MGIALPTMEGVALPDKREELIYGTSRRTKSLKKLLFAGLLAFGAFVFVFTTGIRVGYRHWGLPSRHATEKARQAKFAHLRTHCADVEPISVEAFVERQDRLARTLYDLGASAYIAEPGASAGYYANLFGSSWGLSERPLLLIMTVVEEEGDIRGQISILTPSFEATRARLLPLASGRTIEWPEWPEEVNPYEVAVDAIPALREGDGLIYVDGAIRQFIVEGLQQAAPGSIVLSAPTEIRRLRERKTQEEIDILKCVNELTILAFRAAREQMYIGMRESDGRQIFRDAMLSAGIMNPFTLVLFGPNAALPHGSGTNRILEKNDLILVDGGGSLYGYESDVTRTFALDTSEPLIDQLDLWDLVYAAQTAAINTARNGTVTADVDAAARRVIDYEGYGIYFTHRLGHGIGLEGHESPYLRGGSEDIILTGHTFSDEPGIYIEGEVGIRLEDCFYINEDGDAVFLTEGVGGQAGSVWEL